MANSFAPTRALLRECLEYPGQSYETLRIVLGVKSASMVPSWIEGKAVPKRPQDWPQIHAKIQRHLSMLKRRGADVELCDSEWRQCFTVFLRQCGKTAENVAADVGAAEWHGLRWERYGEIPFDMVRPKLAERTGFNFTRSAYRRSVLVARERFRAALPAPLDTADRLAADLSATAEQFHEAIRAAVVAVRERSGKTTGALARAIGSSAPCVDYFAGRMRNRLSYQTGMIATMLVGLARYVTEHPEQFDATEPSVATAAIARALEILTQRPSRPKGSVRGRTTVCWDRIEEHLHSGTHRFFRYRCPNGEFAAVVFVRFAIAYEQSRWTTAQAAERLEINAHRLGEWFNGRSLPDVIALPKLEEALDRFEGKRAQRPPPREAPAAALLVASPPPPAPPVAKPTSVEAAPTTAPTDGASDFVIAMASIGRGLRQQYRAGWRPDEASRRHLLGVTQSLMNIGRFTAEDLEPKQAITVSGEGSPAVDAVRELIPQLGSSPNGNRAKRRNK